jgi:CBS domain-containing membrane protein
MTTNILTASPDDDPVAMARHMLEHKVGCLPVVEDGKLVGIVSEADFVRWALELVSRAAA